MIENNISGNSVFYAEALRKVEEQEPDIDLVVKLLEKGMENGDYRAMYALGTWYLHGKNLPVDIKKGIGLIKDAAKNNLTDAMFDLAIAYEKGVGVPVDNEAAFQLYLRSALCGDVKSIYEVGRCYYYGLGVSKDEELGDVIIKIYEEKDSET